ncbi:hypothetical protein Fcan01_16285 [Folsomia candida]|uniref:Uncharacterized protein n=1 Tax=Folsomia candida TaxID=158441 RepID=A0A226DV64_FOLCA|nr:hypothetical protein Fcan01_16285 [Folsomia candida]
MRRIYSIQGWVNKRLTQPKGFPPPPGKKLDTLTIMLSMVTAIIAATLPFLYAIFVSNMTLQDHFSHFEFILANAICPLETYFVCRSITFLVLSIYYGYLAFHSTATIVGALIIGAEVLNMLITSINYLARMSPNLHSIRTYQRFCILNKTMEKMSNALASLLLSFGFVFTVTCNFVSVRMYRVIPIPFYFVFPVGSLGATVGIMILLPFGIACHEASTILVLRWRMALKMKSGGTRDQEKLGNALRPVGN